MGNRISPRIRLTRCKGTLIAVYGFSDGGGTMPHGVTSIKNRSSLTMKFSITTRWKCIKQTNDSMHYESLSDSGSIESDQEAPVSRPVNFTERSAIIHTVQALQIEHSRRDHGSKNRDPKQASAMPLMTQMRDFQRTCLLFKYPWSAEFKAEDHAGGLI